MKPGVFGSRAAKALLAGLLLLGVVLGISACGGNGSSVADSSSTGPADTTDAAETAGADGEVSDEEIDSLTIAFPFVPEVLTTTRDSTQGFGLTLPALEPLLRYDQGKVVPDLAESFEEVSPTEYSFALRKGVKFWDGTPLTAKDVLYSYEVHYKPDSESYIGQQWSGVKSVTAKGQNIVIKLEKANPQFLYTIAQTGVFSAKYAEEAGDKLGTPAVKNMGTGPYEFGAFKPNASLELVRNEHYWGKKPHTRRIEARVLTADNLLLAAQGGELDGIFNIPVSQITAMEGVPDYELSKGVEASVYKFDFSMQKEPWSDIHVRRALAYCLNREAIEAAVFSKGAEGTSTLVPPSIAESIMPKAEVDSAYSKIENIVPGYDLEKAKEELSKSSVPDGFHTKLVITATDPNLSAIGQIVAQEAAKIGIDIEVKEVDDTTYYDSVYFQHTGEGLGLDNYSADGPDPINIPVSVLSSANALPQGSGVNSADYESPVTDKLLGQYMALPTESDQRGPTLVKILEQAAKELPYAPIVFPDAFLGVKSEFGYPTFSTFWWLEDWPEDFGLAAG